MRSGHWNYRVVRRRVRAHMLGDIRVSGYTIYGIHRAYYDRGKQKPFSVTWEPIEFAGNTLKELKEICEMTAEAFRAPILEWSDFALRSSPNGKKRNHRATVK